MRNNQFHTLKKQRIVAGKHYWVHANGKKSEAAVLNRIRGTDGFVCRIDGADEIIPAEDFLEECQTIRPQHGSLSLGEMTIIDGDPGGPLCQPNPATTEIMTRSEGLRARGCRVDVVKPYAELLRIRDNFATGKYPFLIVISTDGLGKSIFFQNVDRIAYTKCSGSAVGIYQWVFEHKELPCMCFDDMRNLFSTAQGRDLIKSLGNDSLHKIVAWQKQNKELQAAGIPREYSITSSICFLLNDLPAHNSLDMDAIYGRAKTVFFVPSVYEVHQYASVWWPRKHPAHADITDFIGQNLRRITRPSIRWYTDAIREKNAGEDWRHWLMVQWENADPLLSIIADIRDAGLQSEVHVLGEWKRRTRGYRGHEHGLGRTWYFRCLKQYRQAQGLLDIQARLDPPTDFEDGQPDREDM